MRTNENPNGLRLFGGFLAECQDAQQLHYHSLQELEQRYQRIMDDYLGTLEKDGRMQQEQNRQHANILHELKADFPHFSRRRILLFSYTMAALPTELIQKRVQLSCKGSVYSMKCLMIKDISVKNCPRQNEYLTMLRG